MSIDKLKDDTVIVFIDGSNLYTTPKVVQESIAHDDVFGSPLPIVIVTDAKMEKLLGAVGHYAIKDPNGLNELKGALAEYRGQEAPDLNLTKHSPEKWQDSRGRTLQAAYVSSTDKEVTLRLKDGKLSTMKLSLLSEASKKRVAQLTKETEEAAKGSE